MPFQNVVVGLDLEPTNSIVIDFASAFGARISARMTFVHAEPELPSMSPHEAIEFAIAVHRANEERHRRMMRAAGRWSAGYDEIVRVAGPAAAALQNEAGKVGADLVVIGSGARGSTPDLGRTALRILRSLTLPILIVPTQRLHLPDEPQPEPAGDVPLPEFRGAKIVAAVDFEKGTEAELRLTAALARRLRADVGVLNVVEPPYAASFLGTSTGSSNFPELLAGMLERTEESLRQAAAAAGMDGAQRLAVEGDRPAEAILDAAHKVQADLIVCASHSRGALGRFFLGSTTERLVRISDLPVLVVPAVYQDQGA